MVKGLPLGSTFLSTSVFCILVQIPCVERCLRALRVVRERCVLSVSTQFRLSAGMAPELLALWLTLWSPLIQPRLVRNGIGIIPGPGRFFEPANAADARIGFPDVSAVQYASIARFAQRGHQSIVQLFAKFFSVGIVGQVVQACGILFYVEQFSCRTPVHRPPQVLSKVRVIPVSNQK